MERTYCAIAKRHEHLQYMRGGGSGGAESAFEHEIWNYVTNRWGGGGGIGDGK